MNMSFRNPLTPVCDSTYNIQQYNNCASCTDNVSHTDKAIVLNIDIEP